MKFDVKCTVFGIVFSKLLKQYYKENEPGSDKRDLIKNVKKEFKAMIIRTPDLAKDNFMADNLKGAAYFFAMAKVIPDMTPKKLDEMIDFFFKTKFMAKFYGPQKKKGVLFSQKYQDKMSKDSIRSQHSEDEMDWRFEMVKADDKEIAYNISKCGVCRLGEREHLSEYTPCLCHMDYPKYKLSGGTLHRDKTLADKDPYCNFDITRD